LEAYFVSGTALAAGADGQALGATPVASAIPLTLSSNKIKP